MGLDDFRSGDVAGMNDDSDVDSSVKDLFPTIRLIDDEDIVKGVEEYVETEIPGYFWKAPAASTPKHHHYLCTKHRGLWLHTLMVATALEERKWTYKNMGFVSYHDLDCARAAVLLHDTKKYGDKYWDGKSADLGHDMQAANAIREIDGLPDKVAECVESHMGPTDRYKGPDPRNHLEMFVHLSDMIGSSTNITPHVYKPPQAILDEFGSSVEVSDKIIQTQNLRD